MSELKPCPFCGGEAWMRISDAPQILRIECRRCHAATTSFVADSIGEKEAAAAWNTRHVGTCKDLGGTGANGEQVFNCSECGCVLSLYDRDGTNTLCTGFIYDYPRYCPACGAKVVDE